MSVKKLPLYAGLLVVGLSGAGSVVAEEGGDDVRARCEAEAAEYGVAPEQLQEYIDGCVMAAGAPAPAAGMAEDAPAAAEMAEDAPAAAEEGGSEAAE
jgi:hypothetical protein